MCILNYIPQIYTVHYTVYSVKWSTLYTVNVHYILNGTKFVNCIFYRTQLCTMYIVQYMILFSRNYMFIYCIVYINVQFTLYIIHCTLNIVQYLRRYTYIYMYKIWQGIRKHLVRHMLTIIKSFLGIVPCCRIPLYTVYIHCILYNVYCTVYIVYCTLYSIQYI